MSDKKEDHIHRPTERMLLIAAEHSIRRKGETPAQKRRDAVIYNGDTQCPKKVAVAADTKIFCALVDGHAGQHETRISDTRSNVIWSDDN